jgi:hypothetical protein
VSSGDPPASASWIAAQYRHEPSTQLRFNF